MHINYSTSKFQVHKFLILIACFFSLSFNNIQLNKYSFVFGQLSFYFIFFLVLFFNYRLKKSALIFISIFLAYLLISTFSSCVFASGLCNSRIITGSIGIIFIFITVEMISFFIIKYKDLHKKIELSLLCSSWALVLLAIPDIIAIYQGDIQNSIFESGLFGGGDYITPRLRGFTQEPSYLGMVISVLYPISIMRLHKNFGIFNFLLVTGFWVCLIFSLSKVGIVTCLILTTIIIFNKNFLKLLSILLIIYLFIYSFIPLDNLLYLNRYYISQWDSGNVDISTHTRVGSIVGAINMFFDNLFLGVGLGNSGFLLPKYYPSWFWLSPEAESWVSAADVGGAPTFAFFPKFLAETGLVGFLLFSWKFIPLFKKILNLHHDYYVRLFSLCFLGFLISSFGVEGYLYIPAWIIFGVLLGRVRSFQSVKGS